MRILVSVMAALICAASAVEARPAPEFIALPRANAALYRPDGQARIAFIFMHRTANFMRHRACGEIAARGFLMLCMNPSSANNEAVADMESLFLDVKDGIAFARKQPGIEKVILLAHSGGGPLLSNYQAVAEQGVAYCRGDNKIVSCSDKVAGLPPADGIVFADAHMGFGVMSMRNLNPSLVLREDGTIGTRPELDPLNPANGFVLPAPHYPRAFLDRYFAAQADMMSALAAKALTAKAAIDAGGPRKPQDDLVQVPSNGVAMLFRLEPDAAGQGTTLRPQKLLKNDGTIVRSIVRTVAVPETQASPLETTYWSVNTYLTVHAVRAKNSLDGFDYCSSNHTVICAAGAVSVPILVAAMGGYMFVRDGERIYEAVSSKDKDFVVIEGAVHGFTPCTACEKTPGQYSNTVRNFFDYVRDWTNARF